MRRSCCWAFLFVCAVSVPAHAAAQDSWLGVDKGKHFGASAVAAGGGYAASMLLVDEPWQRAALGGGFGFGLGIAKEIYDATGHGDPSLRDLTWDFVGCALGVSVALLLDYALRSPKPVDPVPISAAAW